MEQPDSIARPILNATGIGHGLVASRAILDPYDHQLGWNRKWVSARFHSLGVVPALSSDEAGPVTLDTDSSLYSLIASPSVRMRFICS
jgi:hypothetical protein